MTPHATIRALVAAFLNVPPAEVTRDAHLRDDLGADSLDHVELIIQIEYAYGIEINDDTADGLCTVGALEDHVTRATKRKAGAA